MIIRRYFAREVYSTMVGVTLVLVFVFLVNQIIHWLDKAAVGKLAAGLLFHLIALEIPYLVGLLLPLGLYIGILVSYSRFYAENEMTVLFASGMSRWRLTQITLLISAAVFLIVLVLMLWVNPLIAARKNTVISSSSSNSVLATILPGRFQAAPSGRQVFYIDHVDKDRFRAKDIFVAQQPGEDSHWIIVSAKTGDQYIDPKTHDLFIVAKNGYRYQGIPGHKDFQVVKFDQYGVKVASLAREYKATAKDDQALSTWEIIQGMGEKIDYLAEFEWRLSLPVSVILLSILAMLLSQVRPRQGRFQKIVPAVLIYIIYANLIFISQDWLQKGILPNWLGLWWPHALLAVFIVFLAGIQTGWFVNKLKA